jgi:hypothetical protein
LEDFLSGFIWMMGKQLESSCRICQLESDFKNDEYLVLALSEREELAM